MFHCEFNQKNSRKVIKMTLELKLAEKAVEQGEIKFSMFVDGCYPQLEYNMNLYELIYVKWQEYTENGKDTDGSNTFKEVTDQILNERVKTATPEGYYDFKSAMDKIADCYYVEIHQPQMRLAKLKGKKLEIRKKGITYEEIEKRINELEELTLKLLYESNRTFEEAKRTQYEIKKLKDEIHTYVD